MCCETYAVPKLLLQLKIKKLLYLIENFCLRFAQAIKIFKQSGNSSEEAWAIVKEIKFEKLGKEDVKETFKFCSRNFRSYMYVWVAVNKFIRSIGLDPVEFKMKQPKNSFIPDKIMNEAAEMFTYLTSCSKPLLYWSRYV